MTLAYKGCAINCYGCSTFWEKSVPPISHFFLVKKDISLNLVDISPVSFHLTQHFETRKLVIILMCLLVDLKCFKVEMMNI